MINIWEHYPAQNPVTYQPIPLPIIAGEGVTEAIYCPFCRDLFVQVDITGLSSGESVTGGIQGSLDGINWGGPEATLTVDTNGTTMLRVAGALPPYVRLYGIATTNENSEASISLQFHIANMV